jgi:uncharacterized membrane protein
MTVLILYVVTTVIFLALDALMLGFVMAPLFRTHVGDLMAPEMRIAPAAVFYLAYIAGLVTVVSLPALRTGSAILFPAAVIGAMAYGTYEFTNYATLKGWHPSMVALDLTWGTVLTAFSAWAGVAITRTLTTST